MKRPRPIIEESEELPRSRQPITLGDFFPKSFSGETVACHVINATEEDGAPSNTAEATTRPEELPSFSINDLLSLPQETKDALVEILKGDSRPTASTSQADTCASCCIAISFTDEDLLLGSKLHNRPLFVSGYIREQKLSRILIDDGSAVNIMPKSTMNQLGISMDELSTSKLVIQGFNQGGQRVIGMIRLELVIGDLRANIVFHGIDSRTTYRLLLGCPWIHENGVVTSTLHQCFKFYQQGIKKVDADTKPFSEAESHFADAKFYMKSNDISEVISTEVPVAKDSCRPEQRIVTTKKLSEVDAFSGQGNDESRTQVKHEVPKNEGMISTQGKNSKSPVLRYVPLS